MTQPGPPRDDASETSRLAELLECERELERLWSIAEAEARARVEEARGAAERLETELDRVLEAELEQVRALVRAEALAGAEERAARARDQAARYDAVPDEEVVRLADVAFGHLLAGGRSS